MSISAYKARHGTPFEVNSSLSGDKRPATAREYLSTLIDAQWKHSWHWPDDHNSFLDKAQNDLNREMDGAKARIAELEEAQRILSSIERDGS